MYYVLKGKCAKESTTPIKNIGKLKLQDDGLIQSLYQSMFRLVINVRVLVIMSTLNLCDHAFFLTMYTLYVRSGRKVPNLFFFFCENRWCDGLHVMWRCDVYHVLATVDGGVPLG